MHAERKVRAAFNRDIGNKVLFIKDRKLLFIKGIKLKAIADRKSYFASLRAPGRPSPSSSSPSCRPSRHSTCGSSMSWATSPTDPAPPPPPDSPALDAGLFFSLSPSIGAVPDAVFQLTQHGPRKKLPACSLIRQHMPAARVPGCRGSLPRHPPVRIASILRMSVPVTLMLFINRVRELPSREGQGPAFPRSPSMSQQASFGQLALTYCGKSCRSKSCKAPPATTSARAIPKVPFRGNPASTSAAMPRLNAPSKEAAGPARHSLIQLEKSHHEPATAAGSRRSDHAGRAAFRCRAQAFFEAWKRGVGTLRAVVGDGTREGLNRANTKWDLRPRHAAATTMPSAS
ncbi:hypothetical protein CDEF62S_04989 [Castellaniella defragrans]